MKLKDHPVPIRNLALLRTHEYMSGYYPQNERIMEDFSNRSLSSLFSFMSTPENNMWYSVTSGIYFEYYARYTS